MGKSPNNPAISASVMEELLKKFGAGNDEPDIDSLSKKKGLTFTQDFDAPSPRVARAAEKIALLWKKRHANEKSGMEETKAKKKMDTSVAKLLDGMTEEEEQQTHKLAWIMLHCPPQHSR